MKVAFKIEGLKKIQNTLEALAKGAMRRHCKAAVLAGSRPIARIAKATAPRGMTGLLKKSIGSKSAVYRDNTLFWAGIGARKKVRMSESPYPGGRAHYPAKIAHLVEKGHRIVPRGQGKNTRPLQRIRTRAYRKAVRFGQLDPLRFVRLMSRVDKRLDRFTRGYVKAKPFLGPAFSGGMGQAKAAIMDRLSKGVGIELSKK